MVSEPWDFGAASAFVLLCCSGLVVSHCFPFYLEFGTLVFVSFSKFCRFMLLTRHQIRPAVIASLVVQEKLACSVERHVSLHVVPQGIAYVDPIPHHRTHVVAARDRC